MTVTIETAEILNLQPQSEHKDLIVATRSWPKGADETPAAADALANDDYKAFVGALGAPTSVTLTADGRGVNTEAWCACGNRDFADEVRYERWTAEGRVAHGYVCPVITCRRLVQSG